MNKDELKELVKKYFSLTEKNNTPEETPKAFAEAKLIDGTVITNMQDSEFAVGNVVHVITSDGEHVVAPSGEHELESGIVITIDGEGIITGIKRPGDEGEGSLAEHEEEMSSESVEEEVTEETSEEKTELAEHDVQEDAIPAEAQDAAFDEGEIKEAIVEAIAEVVAPEIEALKQKMADIEEQMKDYMSEPAAVPTKQGRFNKIQEIKSNKERGASESFNPKKAQMEMVLNAFKSKIKTTA